MVKKSQIDTKNDKIPKIVQIQKTNTKFQRFYAFFVSVSTNFVDWDILKGQQKNGCPVVFNEEIVALFWMKISIKNWHGK